MKADLDNILKEYFGSGYEREESPCCESYGKLTSLLYALSELGVVDNVNEIVEALDDISSENAYRDENGELIYDADEIDRRNAYEPLVEKAYELYKQDWCSARGYNISEADEERGFNGEIYACMDEFEGNEFEDEKYMRKILSGEDFALWEKVN